jgi:hypothetical protein
MWVRVNRVKHSLSEQGHIGHACVPWDGEEWHGGQFLFCSTKSVFFHFRSAEIRFLKKGILKKEVSSMKNNDFQAE